MYVIGPRGGRSRETYPLPQRTTVITGSALVQMGFDMPVESIIQEPSVASFDSLIERNAAGNPLRVQLPGVTPGNILVVDASGLTSGFSEGSKGLQRILPVVSFDGTTTYTPGSGFFWIENALQESNNVLSIVEGDFYLRNGFRCFVAIEIPNGATTATVQLAYTSAVGFFVGGTASFGSNLPAITLAASELLAAAVPQVGPASLVAY